MTEQGTARAVLPGVELARILSNAYVMVPARAQEQHFTVNIGDGFVMAGGSDGYMAGIDYAEAQTTGDINRGVSISRDSLEDIERIARLTGKKNNVQLLLKSGALRLLYQDENGDVQFHDAEEAGKMEAEVWNLILDLMDPEEFKPEFPKYSAFNPALFARLAKVKAEQKEAMDIWWGRADERPALVKVGPTFVALVMPLDRDRSRKYSPTGHWDEVLATPA